MAAILVDVNRGAVVRRRAPAKRKQRRKGHTRQRGTRGLERGLIPLRLRRP